MGPNGDQTLRKPATAPVEHLAMPASHSALLGQMLLEAGQIGQDDLDKALAFQREYGGRLGSILVRMGALAEAELLGALSLQLGLPVMGSNELPRTTQAYLQAIELSRLGAEWWTDQEAAPWEGIDGTVLCIARDPLSPALAEIVEQAFQPHSVQWCLALNQDLDRVIDQIRNAYIAERVKPGDDIAHLREMAEEAPVIELVSNTLAQAFNDGASDVHVEPGERAFKIRYRIDGVLETRLTLPRERYDAVASRIKLVAGIDIAERRLPQDGRFSVRLSGEEIDVRVSSVPGVWGESIVLRLLPKERQETKLDSLGMAADTLSLYRRQVAEPHGVILVTGPTGSGKSTTLYATLEEINDGQQKIITVEDPVEYNVSGVAQIQVQSEIGYTFARALRAVLRQDPDTIMIGEIRDLETSQIAVQAALTGHQVFSTLHTNDALGAFTRLIDMGMEPFLVASSVRLAVAQRLLRRLCPDCAAPWQPPAEVSEQAAELSRRFPGLGADSPKWRKGVGCRACRGTGYRGRTAIYELVIVTPEIHEAILGRAGSRELLDIASRQGFRSLREDAVIKASGGVTSFEEVVRVTGIGEAPP